MKRDFIHFAAGIVWTGIYSNLTDDIDIFMMWMLVLGFAVLSVTFKSR